MRHTTFKKRFEQIFTEQRLMYELSRIKPPPPNFETIRKELREGSFFDIAPKTVFFIPKKDGTYREIAPPKVKTKIIQKILATEFSATFRFSDRNYAFRKGKSPYKAIKRVQDTLRRFHCIAKADIENFFDTIDHHILIDKLHRIIEDKRIVELIAYYLSKGVLRKGHWVDKTEGIYQGDVLSPILSNIYMNDFDLYMEKRGLMHIRYADDLLFFGKSKEEAANARTEAENYLRHKLKLRFNAKKSYTSDVEDGFEYLGIYIKQERISIDTERLAKKIDKLKNQTSKLSLQKTIEKLNEKTTGFLNYYAKLIDDTSQIRMLQQTLEEILVEKIIISKEKNKVSSKRQFKELLHQVKTYVPVVMHRWTDSLIEEAYERIRLKRPLHSARKKANEEKRLYLQRQIKASEIVVTEPGSFLGFVRGKIKLKIKGKIVTEAPINRIRRILLLTKQCSISAYLIYECAKRKIDIDFINNATPYALLTYHQHVMPQVHLAQLKAHFSPRSLMYAREIVHTKSRNQINLIKYFNRRRKDSYLQEKIESMLKLHYKVKSASDKKALMGLEGNISSHYWNAFGYLSGEKDFVRTHKDSVNTLNQALNYGYAILYNRVRSALIHEGLNLYYPFLHVMQPNKPTLVFDMVEDFRQPVVDREILSILGRNQKLLQTNGRLSKDTVKLLIQNIQERLATPTPSRYGKTPLYHIIRFQMNHLKRTLLDATTYKGFVNKY
jgi:group II intron reverse transcriptase/maturase/CRISPR-associated endonuclease Cas1